MRFCRTNASGLLLEIEEGQIDGEPPPEDSKNWFLFQEDGAYLYFWTYLNKQFRKAIDAVRCDITAHRRNTSFSASGCSRAPLREVQDLHATPGGART